MEVDNINNYKNYLEDCLQVLHSRAEEARADANNRTNDFDKGRALGYYETVTYLLNQLVFYEIKDEINKSIRDLPPLRF